MGGAVTRKSVGGTFRDTFMPPAGKDQRDRKYGILCAIIVSACGPWCSAASDKDYLKGRPMLYCVC